MSPHPIVHIEIPCKDVPASAKFYNEAFGWPSEASDSAGVSYTLFSAAPGPGGGFVALDDHYKVGEVVIYIGTDDMEATVAQAVAAGGTVLMPIMEIPNNGWMAWVADPTGNRIGIFKAPMS